jgi:hypothetical protein
VRQDHLNEQKERDSKIEVTREEEGVERKIGEMMQAILKRYHEEQVWSDKVSATRHDNTGKPQLILVRLIDPLTFDLRIPCHHISERDCVRARTHPGGTLEAPEDGSGSRRSYQGKRRITDGKARSKAA